MPNEYTVKINQYKAAINKREEIKTPNVSQFTIVYTDYIVYIIFI